MTRSRKPCSVACGGPNLRGATVVVEICGREMWGTVITHTQNNRWLIQFTRPLPSGLYRATFDRREFMWAWGGPEE